MISDKTLSVVFSLAFLFVFTGICAAAPDSSGGKNSALHKDARDGVATKTRAVRADESADGAFCAKAQRDCIDACTQEECNAARTQSCLDNCLKASGTCCSCDPIWSSDGFSWAGRTFKEKSESKSDSKTNLAPKAARSWDPETPTQMCANNFSDCTKACKSVTLEEGESPCTDTCIESCLQILGTCCDCRKPNDS